MNITIYDYDNEATNVIIPDDKAIESIYVEVLSGDEVGIIKFTDGTHIRFDASDCRMHDWYDGSYVVCGDNLQKWIDYDFSNCRITKSYHRQSVFDTLDD